MDLTSDKSSTVNSQDSGASQPAAAAAAGSSQPGKRKADEDSGAGDEPASQRNRNDPPECGPGRAGR